METVYIDVLIVLNTYVTFLLLKATAALLHKKTRRVKMVIACALGGLCSLSVLLPPLLPAVSVVYKIISGAIIAETAFDDDTLRARARTMLVFFITSAAFGGIIMLFWLFGKGVNFPNGQLYIDVSFVTIVVSSAAAYSGIKILRRFFDGKASDKKYTVCVTHKGGETNLSGFADSGNNITDMFTGKHVLLLSREATRSARPIIPSNIPRPIPVKTAMSEGLITVFRVEGITITDEDGEIHIADMLIGIAAQNFEEGIDAVFNPKILKY